MQISIWDDVSEPPNNLKGYIFLWKGNISSNYSDAIPIPQLIEKNDLSLRKRYLEFVYDFGQIKFFNKSLVEHLEIYQDFSFWWMSLISEKCNWEKSPQIVNIIRLYLLEDWAKKNAFDNLVLYSSNKLLAQCLEKWSVENKKTFKWKKISKNKISTSWKRYIYFSLPKSLQAVIWFLKFLYENWALKGIGIEKWKRSKANITFFSYLFNLDKEATKSGVFKCNYWTELPKALSEKNINTNWLHLYIKDSNLKNSKDARLAIEKFNCQSDKYQTHVTLVSFLSFRVIIKSLNGWIKLRNKVTKFEGKVQNHEKIKIIWPLLKEDWNESIYGQTSLSNILTFNLFSSAMEKLPTQSKGIYLQENQGWEIAMVSLWKKFKHNIIVGFPHSTVRFWDFVYFFDSRNYSDAKRLQIPLPDQIAYNGNATLKAFIEGNYPKQKLKEVESLRYLYISKYYETNLKKFYSKTQKNKRLLVVGDYVEKNTFKQLKILDLALPLLNSKILICFKPHPASSIDISFFSRIKMKIETKSLEEIIHDFDIVYSSASTSASVDAYCAGLKVMSYFDGEDLNLSPLRGYKGAIFISSPEELANELNKKIEPNKISYERENYFCIDKKLPRWKDFLGSK